MFRAAFEFDTQVIIDAQRNLVNSPKLLERAMKRRQPRLRKIVLPILRVKPGKPKYPIRWKTPKQRRAYYATDGFGGGIPSTRSDALIDAYDAKFEFDANGGSFVIENTAPHFPFVSGDDQQPFHADTGWIDAEETIDNRIVPLVLNDFEETFYSVADPFVRQT